MKNIGIVFWIVALMINDLCATEKILEFQRLPKAELHLHLGGSFPKEYLFSIATTEQQEELEKGLSLIAKGVDYSAAFPVFQVIAQIVNTEEKVQRGVESLCASLREDNICYVEIRTGLRDLGQGCEEYLKAVLAGIEASACKGFKANLILSLQRSSSMTAVQKTIDLALKYQNRGVVGIDISGDSTIGQIDRIMPQLIQAKEAGLSYVVHMGEVPNEADQMLLLTMLEPKRIGHGVYLSKEAKEWILSHQIPIEVCLTSSVLVKMINHYEQHPGIEFFQLGHPIVLCTDDPLLFSITMSKEVLYAHEFCRLTDEDLRQIIENAFYYALEEMEKPEISQSGF